jgi:hypothetical protein
MANRRFQHKAGNGMSSGERALAWAAAGLGLAAGAYVAYVTYAWSRYGAPATARRDEEDVLLDQFMPFYEVAERHHASVAAPPAITLAAATGADLMGSPIVRAIVRAREVVLRAAPAERRPTGLLDEMTTLGWRVLAEVPGREIVVGRRDAAVEGERRVPRNAGGGVHGLRRARLRQDSVDLAGGSTRER